MTRTLSQARKVKVTCEAGAYRGGRPSTACWSCQGAQGKTLSYDIRILINLYTYSWMWLNIELSTVILTPCGDYWPIMLTNHRQLIEVSVRKMILCHLCPSSSAAGQQMTSSVFSLCHAQYLQHCSHRPGPNTSSTQDTKCTSVTYIAKINCYLTICYINILVL